MTTEEAPSALDPLDFKGRLIVHVGIHKTGTTSIQRGLDAGYERLRGNGILYPKAGRRNESATVLHLHHPLILSLIEGDEQAVSHHIEALRTELDEAAPKTMILSSEVLSREYLSSQVFREIQGIFPKATRSWIIYLRRQDRLALSRYAEDIKRGLVAWPDGVRHTTQPIYLDHRLRLERLQHSVGEDTIVPVAFDEAKHRLMASFFEAADLDLPNDMVGSHHANVSLPWGTLQMLRIANAMPGSTKSFFRRVVFGFTRRISRTWAGRVLDWPEPLSPDDAQDVLARYEASNRWVEEVFWNEHRFLTGNGHK